MGEIRADDAVRQLSYRYAVMDDLDVLVQLRVRDLAMFSHREPDRETVESIRCFYYDKMKENSCITILGYHGDVITATATVYYYRILPSNENPQGVVGQITNVWVDEMFRRRGIASFMVRTLMDKSRGRAGLLCLNSSPAAVGMYRSIGFKGRENYLVYELDSSREML